MEHVAIDFTSIFMTILNLGILAVIIFVIIIVVKKYKSSNSKNKEINKKLDDILNIISNLLEDKRR